MSSKITIINRALSRLAQQRIISLNDDTNAAKLVNAIYDEVAEEVMSRGAWTSTLFRAQLSRLSDTPTFGYRYTYQLPTLPRCIRVLGVDEYRPGIIDWKVEGDKLLTDEPAISIKYIGFVEDAQKYDVDLKQAIVWALVAEMCYTFTGKDDTADRLADKAERKINDLLSMNGLNSGSNDSIPSNMFVDVRYD